MATAQPNWDEIARKLQSLADRGQPGGITGLTGAGLAQTLTPASLPPGYAPVRAWGEGHGQDVGWTGSAPTIGGQEVSNFFNLGGRTYAPQASLEQMLGTSQAQAPQINVTAPPTISQPSVPTQQSTVSTPIQAAQAALNFEDYMAREQFQSPESIQRYAQAIMDTQQPLIDSLVARAMKQAASSGAERGIWNTGIQSQLESEILGEIMSGVQSNAMEDAWKFSDLAMKERGQSLERFLQDRAFQEQSRQFDIESALERSKALGYIGGAPTAQMQGILDDRAYKQDYLGLSRDELDANIGRWEADRSADISRWDADRLADIARWNADRSADVARWNADREWEREKETSRQGWDNLKEEALMSMQGDYIQKLQAVRGNKKDYDQTYRDLLQEVDLYEQGGYLDKKAAETLRNTIEAFGPNGPKKSSSSGAGAPLQKANDFLSSYGQYVDDRLNRLAYPKLPKDLSFKW